MQAQDIIALGIVTLCAVLVLRRLLRPLLASMRAEDACGNCSSRCDEPSPTDCDTSTDKVQLS